MNISTMEGHRRSHVCLNLRCFVEVLIFFFLFSFIFFFFPLIVKYDWDLIKKRKKGCLRGRNRRKGGNSRQIQQNHEGLLKVRNLREIGTLHMFDAQQVISMNVLIPHELGPEWVLNSKMRVKQFRLRLIRLSCQVKSWFE